jgi:hypothetical protein
MTLAPDTREATPTRTATRSPTATISPAAQTVTFDDLTGQNQPPNGQHSSGLIDWGSGAWYHSGPYGQLTMKSVSSTAPLSQVAR